MRVVVDVQVTFERDGRPLWGHTYAIPSPRVVTFFTCRMIATSWASRDCPFPLRKGDVMLSVIVEPQPTPAVTRWEDDGGNTGTGVTS